MRKCEDRKISSWPIAQSNLRLLIHFMGTFNCDVTMGIPEINGGSYQLFQSQNCSKNRMRRKFDAPTERGFQGVICCVPVGNPQFMQKYSLMDLYYVRKYSAAHALTDSLSMSVSESSPPRFVKGLGPLNLKYPVISPLSIINKFTEMLEFDTKCWIWKTKLAGSDL